MAEDGSWLRRLRQERNLTQDQLAERAGTTRQMIGDYELGKASPSLYQLDKIAKGLSLTTAQLLAERGDKATVSEGVRAYGDTDAPRAVHAVDLPLFETVPAGPWSDVSQEETGTFPVLHHLAGQVGWS